MLAELAGRCALFPESSGVWGDKKGRALLASRICLNLHYEDSRVFESPRLWECFANGRFVLSEPVADPWPYVPGEDFAVFDSSRPGALAKAAAHWLARPGERAEMAQRARAKAERFPLEMLAARILSRLREVAAGLPRP